MGCSNCYNDDCPHPIDWEDEKLKWSRTATCKCGSTVTNTRKEVKKEIAIEQAYNTLRKVQKERSPPPPKTRTRVRIFKIDKEISDDIELKNKKSNPFGWSQSEIHYDGERIGWIESGGFDMNDGYLHTETKEVISPKKDEEE